LCFVVRRKQCEQAQFNPHQKMMKNVAVLFAVVGAVVSMPITNETFKEELTTMEPLTTTTYLWLNTTEEPKFDKPAEKFDETKKIDDAPLFTTTMKMTEEKPKLIDAAEEKKEWMETTTIKMEEMKEDMKKEETPKKEEIKTDEKEEVKVIVYEQASYSRVTYIDTEDNSTISFENATVIEPIVLIDNTNEEEKEEPILTEEEPILTEDDEFDDATKKTDEKLTKEELLATTPMPPPFAPIADWVKEEETTTMIPEETTTMDTDTDGDMTDDDMTDADETTIAPI